MILADLTPEHINRRVRVYSKRSGTLSGDLGLLFHMPDLKSTLISLWRDDRCVQESFPSSTECEILP